MLVEEVMTELGLSLSPEKTKIAGYGKGYEFLGFRLSSKSERCGPSHLRNSRRKFGTLPDAATTWMRT